MFPTPRSTSPPAPERLMPTTFAKWLFDHPALYHAYSYSYPHKSAYRPLGRPRTLGQVWSDQDRSSLFLYAHVPFCEMRCGFCNLFTMARPKPAMQEGYMQALTRQVQATRRALGDDATFSRVAVGGGTPTLLEPSQLHALFDLLERDMGAALHDVPVSCEASPETLTTQKLEVLKSRGVNRLSIGVQSFVDEETRAVRRPQVYEQVVQTLQNIARYDFELFNIDLIYGIQGQTPQSWRRSLTQTLSFAPEEIFLYPLYVRPLTGLGNRSQSWDDQRLELYNIGREFLLEHGYEQASMRLFRRRDLVDVPGPDYVYQRDGMVGLGPGARSYTDGLHYSTDYAVGRRGVVSIIEDYIGRDSETFERVDYGFELDEDERKRRFFIISLLSHEGLDAQLYEDMFGSPLIEDFVQIQELVHLGLVQPTPEGFNLTTKGMSYEDAIGPWLYSPNVHHLMQEAQRK